jgi:hypothetical protein
MLKIPNTAFSYLNRVKSSNLYLNIRLQATIPEVEVENSNTSSYNAKNKLNENKVCVYLRICTIFNIYMYYLSQMVNSKVRIMKSNNIKLNPIFTPLIPQQWLLLLFILYFMINLLISTLFTIIFYFE